MAGIGRMPSMGSSMSFLLVLIVFVQFAKPAAAFGAGNIASISRIEGKNWRHGDIEDTLKTIAFIKGHKWTSMMVKRVYFGNWLRDYSQAVDVGTLKGVQAESIRVLLWVLSFLTFGYATQEFEVTAERLGCYRPEEHIDNPKDYADNQDARKYDPRLRGPVQPIELEIDPQTGLKNYIANERLQIATSAGYVKHSLNRCIHFGRLYRHGSFGSRGREEDLCEALRCLGQALHCCEDFGAHSNYCELALREMGHRNVFPHCGVQTEIDLQGRRVFPIVTGTFGGVDFLHSVIGEANDHFTQSEVDQLDKTLGVAQTSAQSTSRGLDGESEDDSAGVLIGLLGQLPGVGDFAGEARQLQAASQEQERLNATRGIQGSGGAAGGYGGEQGYQASRGYGDRDTYSSEGFQGDRGYEGREEYDSNRGIESSRGYEESSRADTQQAGSGIPGANLIPSGVQDINPQEVVKRIYPILVFRDRIAKSMASIIEKIPGLEALVERITETLTLFVLRLMAPFVRPVIDVVSKQLKSGSSAIIDTSGKHQYEPWTDPQCTDPTHSLLSKDHFTNILNEVAGQVASQILKYVVPRVLWAWEHPDADTEQVMADVLRVFHHPAIRDMNNEVHRNMFETVERWSRQCPHNIDDLLSSESVRAGKNQIGTEDPAAEGGSALGAMQAIYNNPGGSASGGLGHSNSAWAMIDKISGSSSGGGGGGGNPLGNLTSVLGKVGGGGHGGGGGNPIGNITSALGNLSGLGGKSGLKIPGLSRDLDFEQQAGSVGRAFPGTETEYDNRPTPGAVDFDDDKPAPQYEAGAFGYQTGPQYQGGYEQGYQGGAPPPQEYGRFDEYGGGRLGNDGGNYGGSYGGPPAGGYSGPPAGGYGGPPTGAYDGRAGNEYYGGGPPGPPGGDGYSGGYGGDGYSGPQGGSGYGGPQGGPGYGDGRDDGYGGSGGSGGRYGDQRYAGNDRPPPGNYGGNGDGYSRY